MPYIKSDARRIYDLPLQTIIKRLKEGGNNPGEVNYCLSTIIWHLFDGLPSYSTANSLLGVLSAVEQEFYRRRVMPYEDKKIIENGDL